LGTEIVATLVKEEANPERRKQLINEAIPYLRKSLSIYPEYTDGNASLGDAFFQLAMMGRPELYDSAEYYDKRSLATNPNFTVAINNLAGVYFMQKQYPKALEVCRKAVQLNPGYVNAYTNLGLCYMNLGRMDSALYSLYKAVSIDPSFKQAYANLALTYKAMGNADSVRKYDALSK
ncbi:MAG: tetratricopeptide repeat protein, partial [Chitinophagia bacterium]|nr:tetratricopeptide repeat protein [Chitinophagia bacterium]